MSRKNPRKIIRQQTYEKRFDELRSIHQFSFRKRKKFTPAQKAAITRLYKQHRFVLGELDQGRGIFKKATPKQVRALKQSDIRAEGFTVTNRGIVVKGLRADKVRAGKQRVYIRGKGKQTRIDVQLPSRRELFVPYLATHNGEPESFPDFVARIIKQYKPDDILIQNENGRGRDRYSPRAFMKYVNRDITPRIADFKARYGVDENPFVGVWLIFYKF